MKPLSELDQAIGPDPRGPLLTNEEFEAAMKKVKPLKIPWDRDPDEDDRDWEYFAGIGNFRWK